MDKLIIIGIVIAIIGIILIILINQYNKFQWSITLIQKAETNILNALEKKYNILIRYLDILKDNKVDIDEKEYEEYKLLNLHQPVIELNKKIIGIHNTVSRYMDTNEKLLKNESIININKELQEVDININGGKKFYNDNLTIYNNLCNSFPSIIVGKLKRYKEKEYLDSEIKEELKILDE